MKADRYGSRPRRVSDRIRVTVPGELAAAVAAVVTAVTGRAAEIQVCAADPGAAPRARILGILDLEDEAERVAGLLVARLESLERRHPGAHFELEREEHFVEEDRCAAHREQFRPFLAAPGLVVTPAWEPYTPAPGEIVLALDPGPAFGSGVHASTRLALALLKACCTESPPPRLLDMGTGTGILALAGALWGAGEVVAVDNDPDAVAAARANVLRNGLAPQVRVHGGPLGKVAGAFDLIVANITLDALDTLAVELAGRVAPGGAIVLSGLLAGGQDAEIRTVYEGLGFRCEATREEGEWVALLLCGQRGEDTR